MKNPTCSTCPHWDDRQNDDGCGICRKHAPKAALHRNEDDPDAEFPVWPLTLASEWCGEHPKFAAFADWIDVPEANDAP